MVIAALRATARGRCLGALCLLLGGGSAAAQEYRTTFRLPLHLMDLSFAADTVSGVQILMQPSARSKQGKEPDGLVWLWFHPDTLLEWINGAALALRVPAPNAQPDGIQWSRALLPSGGRGAVSVGRERKKGKLQKGYWLAIADSAAGWRAEMNGSEADSLLKLLLVVGSLSRLDTAEAAAPEASATEVPASVIHQPPPKSIHDRAGRVAMAYVVKADGTVEEGSMVAYLASDAALVPLAAEVLRRSRFRPAQKAGEPVRQRMRQTIVW